MSGFPEDLLRDAEMLLQHLRAQQRTLATAESCTGGLLSALMTEIAGCSDVFTHGFITYANAAKTSMVGVPETRIAQHGAVSAHVAIAMAEGALATSGAHVAIAITGIAGPGGATADKPVGLVHMACACRGEPTRHHVQQFSGNRRDVREQAVRAALAMLLQA